MPYLIHIHILVGVSIFSRSDLSLGFICKTSEPKKGKKICIFLSLPYIYVNVRKNSSCVRLFYSFFDMIFVRWEMCCTCSAIYMIHAPLIIYLRNDDVVHIHTYIHNYTCSQLWTNQTNHWTSYINKCHCIRSENSDRIMIKYERSWLCRE